MKKKDVINLLIQQVLEDRSIYYTKTDVRCMFVDLIDNLCHDLTESQAKRFFLTEKELSKIMKLQWKE